MGARDVDDDQVIVVLPSTSYRARAFVDAALDAGIALTLATDVPRAMQRFGRPTLRIDLGDPEDASRVIAKHAGGRRVHGLVGTDEATALVAAVAAKRLRLPGHRPEGVLASRDKGRLRRALADHDVPGPRYWALPAGAEASCLPRVEFPCVVKPPMLSGSQGVIRADDLESLTVAIRRIRALLERHPSALRTEPTFHELVIEEYLEGREVALEAVVDRGRLTPIAIFDKPDELIGPFFEETLYVTPTRVEPAMQTDAIDVTERAARALGLDHGPIHAELRLTPLGARLLEIAARPIGGLCSRAFELFDFSLERHLLALAMGRNALSPPELVANVAVGVMMLPVRKSGVFKEVRGVGAARATPGIEDVVISARPGDAIRALPEGASYLGFLFAKGDSADAVEASLRSAHDKLEITVAPLLNRLP